MAQQQYIMDSQHLQIADKECILFTQGVPQVLLILPIGHHERNTIFEIPRLIADASPTPFALLAIKITEWERDLAPWPDVPIAKKCGEKTRVQGTLRLIEEKALPALHLRFGRLPCVLGGYSLSALFALWASYHSTAFLAIAASSPSVWLKDWLDFAQQNVPLTPNIFLSLGDTEENTHNKYFAMIGENIRAYHRLIEKQLGLGHTTMTWNTGNHFADNPLRTAQGFAWCMNVVV